MASLSTPTLFVQRRILNFQVDASRYLDLRFHLNTRTVPKECALDKNAKSCNMSYAVSYLESFGQFDLQVESILEQCDSRERISRGNVCTILQSAMLQEGTAMNEPGKRHFWDDTVVRIPRKTVEASPDAKVYLGIKFFDLPTNVQGFVFSCQWCGCQMR